MPQPISAAVGTPLLTTQKCGTLIPADGVGGLKSFSGLVSQPKGKKTRSATS